MATIEQTTVTDDNVLIQVRRSDHSIYYVDVIPNDDSVLLRFSNIDGKLLETRRIAANQAIIELVTPTNG